MKPHPGAKFKTSDPDGLWVDGVVSVSPGWVGMASAVYRESR